MYTIKVTDGYGDIDDPVEETVEMLGTYRYRDEAAKAAEDKFDELADSHFDYDVRFFAYGHSRYHHYFTYGYCDFEAGIVHEDHYYRVDVIEI